MALIFVILLCQSQKFNVSLCIVVSQHTSTSILFLIRCNENTFHPRYSPVLKIRPKNLLYKSLLRLSLTEYMNYLCFHTGNRIIKGYGFVAFDCYFP